MNNDLIISQQDMSLEEIQKLRENNINKAMNDIFGINNKDKQELQKLANIYQIKHGMLSTVPMMCKADRCPYYELCQVSEDQRIAGTRCRQEIAVMLGRFEALCGELGIQDNDAVDISLVKEVIDIEMMILRVDNKFALNGDVMVDAWVAVDKMNQDHYGEAVNPLIATKLNLYDKKMKILEKLNSTRKDKAEDIKKKKDPSIKSATLMAKAKMMSNMMKSINNDVAKEDKDEDIIQEVSYTEIEIDGDIVDTYEENSCDEIEDDEFINEDDVDFDIKEEDDDLMF